MLWRRTLRIWLIALSQNASFTLFILLLFTLLNFVILIPLIGVFSFFIQNLINFSLIILFSKIYLKVDGEEEAFRKEVEKLRYGNAFSYVREAFMLTVATYLMSIGVLIIVVSILLLLGLIFGISLLTFGTAPSPLFLLLGLIVALIIYFSVVTSYPSFFARTVIEAKKPEDYFTLFLTAPFSKLLWKLSFSLEVLLSSFIVGAISLLIFIAQGVGTFLFPPIGLFSYFITFVNLLLIYLFGVISVHYLLKRG
ncbi:hypothetical protein JCM9492_16550 [Aquifex pyrophilus]